MRLIKTISWMLLCGTVGFFTTATNAQTVTRVPGQIVVAKIQGIVTATHLTDQTTHTLVEKEVISQQYVVTTGANSRVVLVFSNGATVNLGSDSVLSIEEFLQDPFSDKVAVTALTEEPTTSSTRLNMARGELVGNVKHLKREKGSSFIVNTPVGAAGIRGTTFRIVFRPDASGTVTFTLSVSEGTVEFVAAGQSPVTVTSGQEITVEVEVTVNPATRAVTIVSPPRISVPVNIPPAIQAAIANAAQQIIEAAQTIILSLSPTSAANGGAGQPAGRPSSDEKNKEDEKKPGPVPGQNADPVFSPGKNPLPEIVPPPPDVTPGAGAN
ncbi:MAG: FecR domain-containing protein [Opitutus sp.]